MTMIAITEYDNIHLKLAKIEALTGEIDQFYFGLLNGKSK